MRWWLLLLVLLIACDGCRKPRTTADIRRDGNHLVGQSSLYLQKHAHNPVDWYPWGTEALELASRMGKPIFLSVGYSSCHWCHVMEAEVFEDDEVAAYLNAEYVSIKVDREERPDIDATYMEAVLSMTGSGGWPMTVFMTPKLVPFFGGTYFPKAKFLELARYELAAFRKGGLETPPSSPPKDEKGARLTQDEIKDFATRGLAQFDGQWGGMKSRMKFPTPSRWSFLLHSSRKWGAPFQEAVDKTLDMMASGGLYDHVGGGFFRYCVDPTWSVPHFEKMLYVNAALAKLYLETGRGEIARGVLDFLIAEMQLASGGFAASLDADSGGKEGAFYIFNKAEAGPELATEGVIHRRGKIADFVSERDRLAKIRSTRQRPTRDDKIITAWNGLAIDAFAKGFLLTGEARYREAAQKAADHLWTTRRPLVRTGAGSPAMLDDYAAFASGLISLYEATGDKATLDRATTLTDEMIKTFQRPTGGFFTTRAEGPLERRVDLLDSEEPNGAALALSLLTRLAAITSRQDLYGVLDKALEATANEARQEGMTMAAVLDAALLAGGPYYDVAVARSDEDLLKVWRSLAPPWTVRTELGDGKTPGRAYVCVRGSCKAPTSDSTLFRTQLLDGWTR